MEHKQVLKLTLPPEEILAMKLLLCHVDGCSEHFTNASHLQMHLTRRHKLVIPKSSGVPAENGIVTHYHCPEESCVYNLRASGEKYFTSFRSLKQHFLKVHSAKNFICDRCDGQKSFSTASLLRAHQTNCGKVFCCRTCGLTYGSREALLTHCKRKNHDNEGSLKQNLAKRKAYTRPDQEESSKITRQCTIYVQTDRSHTLGETGKQSRTTQTITSKPEAVVAKGVAGLPLPADVSTSPSNIHLVPNAVSDPVTSVCTETQTDLIYDTMFPNEDRTDPMLYSHMYTQTCDDFISDLGLATIETQTNWEEGLGEFLVSTETQTSTSMEFLNAISAESSSIHTQTS